MPVLKNRSTKGKVGFSAPPKPSSFTITPVITGWIFLLGFDFLTKSIFQHSTFRRLSIESSSPFELKAALAIEGLTLAGYFIFTHSKIGSGQLSPLFWGGLYGLLISGISAFNCANLLKVWSFELAAMQLALGSIKCAILAHLQMRLKKALR